jgi:hypothetical protein
MWFDFVGVYQVASNFLLERFALSNICTILLRSRDLLLFYLVVSNVQFLHSHSHLHPLCRICIGPNVSRNSFSNDKFFDETFERDRFM